jgi:hypothetical protein
MFLIRRSDEMIVGYLRSRRKILRKHLDLALFHIELSVAYFEDFSAFVAERLRFYASFYRSLLYLLSHQSSVKQYQCHGSSRNNLHAMLIGSSTKYCLLALEDLPSLEDVREDHCV